MTWILEITVSCLPGQVFRGKPTVVASLLNDALQAIGIGPLSVQDLYNILWSYNNQKPADFVASAYGQRTAAIYGLLHIERKRQGITKRKPLPVKSVDTDVLAN